MIFIVSFGKLIAIFVDCMGWETSYANRNEIKNENDGPHSWASHLFVNEIIRGIC